MSRCQSTGRYSRNGRKESLLDRHGAPHEGKMTREGADVLVGTRFFRCGELNGFRLGGTKQLGGCDYVTHEGLRESVGGVGAGAQGFLSESYGGDSFLSTTKLWPIAIFGTCPTFLRVSLILVPAFVSKFFTSNCMVSLPVMVTSCTVSLACDVAKNKRCREGEERKQFHDIQGTKVYVKSKSVRTDFWNLDFR